MSPVSQPSRENAVRTRQAIVAAISRLRRRMREVATDDHLTPSQTSVIVLLAKNDAATASALAKADGVRPQSMASTLTALEAAGLIERHPDPSDGRRQLITLTNAGHAQVNGGRAARHEWLSNRIRTELTTEETKTLTDAAAIIERLIGQ